MKEGSQFLFTELMLSVALYQSVVCLLMPMKARSFSRCLHLVVLGVGNTGLVAQPISIALLCVWHVFCLMRPYDRNVPSITAACKPRVLPRVGAGACVFELSRTVRSICGRTAAFFPHFAFHMSL